MKRRKFTSKFKTKVALEAIKESQSLSELAMKYELAPTPLALGCVLLALDIAGAGLYPVSDFTWTLSPAASSLLYCGAS